MPTQLTRDELDDELAPLADETAELRHAVRMLRSVLGAVVRDLYDDIRGLYDADQRRTSLLEALDRPPLRRDDWEDDDD